MNTVPNKPKTPIRGVRVPDEEWHPAQAKAKERGETVTDVVRRALREYVKEGGEVRESVKRGMQQAIDGDLSDWNGEAL